MVVKFYSNFHLLAHLSDYHNHFDMYSHVFGVLNKRLHSHDHDNQEDPPEKYKLV